MKWICRRWFKLSAFHVKLASGLIFCMNEQCADAYFVGCGGYTDQGIPHERATDTALLNR